MDCLKITKENNFETLVFSDNVLKEDIRELKELLLDSINRSDSIAIEFDDLRKTDIFFIQLLCSAHKYAVSKKKKKMEISKELPKSLMIVLEDLGFYRDQGCIKENEESCFWLREVANV